MSVVHVTEGGIRAAHVEDAVHLGLEVAKVETRLGASSSRVLYSLVAGERAQSWVVWSEFDSLAAFGRSVDAGAFDGEVLGLGQRLAAADGPVSVRSRLLAVEVAAGRGGGGKATSGSVVELTVLRPVAGRLDDALGLAHAMGSRVFRLAYAGRSTGLLLASREFDDAGSFGEAADERWSSAKGRSSAAAVAAEDAPATVEWHGLFHAVGLDAGRAAAAAPSKPAPPSKPAKKPKKAATKGASSAKS